MPDHPHRRTPRTRTWLLGLTALALVAAPAAVLALGTDDAGRDSRPSAAPVSGSRMPEIGMEHVHGLGVDPADGTLYAATHFGVFAVADGTATRVGNLQDTMGFAVAGPGTFLGSGHPDFSEDDEPLMGLIESRDAGRTWQPLSLRGQADFHALQVVGDRVFGYDSTSGTFMTTADRRTWERRSRVGLVDFAVRPQDTDVVVGTTGRQLLRSTDGGRTWRPSAQAPRLVVVDVTALGFVGVDASGAVHASSDGESWSRRGTVGAVPAAMAVGDPTGTVLHVADQDGRIVTSRDGGTTFAQAYAP